MADALQAVLISQLGAEQAKAVYSAVLDAALHLRESLATLRPEGLGLDEDAEVSPDSLLQARLRNAARTQAVRGGLLRDALSGREVARALGVSVQAIDQARRADKLVALRAGGSWRYPVWQFDFSAPDPLVPHLPEVAKAAGGFRLAVLCWLAESDEVLGELPLAVLRSERWQQAIRRARQLFITAT